MADDAGSLLVRAGLIKEAQLRAARQSQTEHGGTVGEHLVLGGFIDDDELTAFYRNRLLVPRVNPNDLTRITKRCVDMIPLDMAVEFRCVPVSIDREQNLTVAMGDPSNSHAVDEIAFFTGAYVVRAVATQLQIAWCLAHYYGHITPLGETLLQEQTAQAAATSAAIAAAPPRPPPAAVVAVAADDDDADDDDNEYIDDGGDDNEYIDDGGDGEEIVEITAVPERGRRSGLTDKVDAMRHRTVIPVTGPVHMDRPTDANLAQRAASQAQVKSQSSPGLMAQRRVREDTGPTGPVRVHHRLPTPPELLPRAGEMEARGSADRSPDRALPSVVLESYEDPSAPEAGDGEVGTDSRPILLGAPSPTREVVLLERPKQPSAEAAATASAERKLRNTKLGLAVARRGGRQTDPDPTVGVPVMNQAAAPPDAVDEVLDLAPDDREPDHVDEATGEVMGLDTEPSVSIEALAGTDDIAELERVRAAWLDQWEQEHAAEIDGVPAGELAASDTGPSYDLYESDRGATSPGTRRIDSDSLDRAAASGVIDVPTGKTPMPREEPTVKMTVDISALEDAYGTDENDRSDEYEDGYDGYDDDGEYVDEDDEEFDREYADDELPGRPGASRTGYAPIRDETTGPLPRAHKLDAEPTTEPMLPGRSSPDEGWGPPGTTIPPPLLGALPGRLENLGSSSSIPIPLEEEFDSQPVHGSIAAAAAAAAREVQASRARPAPPADTVDPVALDQSSTRVVESVRDLDRAASRDAVVDVLLRHVGGACARAAFLAVRAGEMHLFSSRGVTRANKEVLLRLDQPSTFQDVVRTRVSFRGPLEDELSRRFALQAMGGQLGDEILAVPVTVRGRVVGLLFGDQRRQPLFVELISAVARAGGLALERILQKKKDA